MTQVFALRPLGLGMADEDGVIPAAIVDAMSDAERIRAEARAEAEAIRNDAVAARESEMRRGHAEGMAKAQADAAVWMLQARQDLETRLDRIQTELAEVVTGCVRKIVLSFDNRDLAIETVRTALAALRSEKKVQLHVDPAAESSIRAALPSLMKDYPEIELIDVISDPSLKAPDVRLESELGVVTMILGDTLSGLDQLLRGARVGG